MSGQRGKTSTETVEKPRARLGDRWATASETAFWCCVPDVPPISSCSIPVSAAPLKGWGTARGLSMTSVPSRPSQQQHSACVDRVLLLIIITQRVLEVSEHVGRLVARWLHQHPVGKFLVQTQVHAYAYAEEAACSIQRNSVTTSNQKSNRLCSYCLFSHSSLQKTDRTVRFQQYTRNRVQPARWIGTSGQDSHERHWGWPPITMLDWQL